jgi:hypothetical protein
VVAARLVVGEAALRLLNTPADPGGWHRQAGTPKIPILWKNLALLASAHFSAPDSRTFHGLRSVST